MFYKFLDKIANDSDFKNILESSQSIFNHIINIIDLLYIEENNKANQKRNTQEIFHLNFMPIECFKNEAKKYFKGDSLYHQFLSSGTSSLRSKSLFSKKGLTYYKISSLLYFKYVMDDFWGINSLGIKGYSLIPHSSIMKDSSLSTMISWIAEYWNVEFLSIDDFIQKFTDNDSITKDPIWIFATAIEFDDIIDKLKSMNKKIFINENSAIIETGGNKGKNKKELIKSQLYSSISSYFNISSNNIISEYGMSELASSAYDWLSFKKRQSSIIDIEERYFRFAPWVFLDVERLDANSNIGPLIIDDKLRIDYPYPIRTQDICSLGDKNSFQYGRRVPSSVLKGCSLSMPQIQKENWLDNFELDSNTFLKINKKDLLNRITTIDSFLKKYLESSEIKQLYSKVLESSKQNIILEDIFLSLPIDQKSWLNSIYASLNLSMLDRFRLNLGFDIELKYFDTILMMFSSTNEMALIYPISIAYICGFKTLVKLSTRSDNILSLSFINSLNEYIKNKNKDTDNTSNNDIIKLIDPYTPPQHSIHVGSIFISGDTSTINLLNNLYPNRVQGFGSSIAISLTDTIKDFNQIKKDAFLLQQKGCLSSRALFIINQNISSKDVLASIDSDTSWLSSSSNYCYSLKNEEDNFILKNILFKKRTFINEPLFPIYEYNDLNSFNWNDILSSYPFTLPIIIIKQNFSDSFLFNHIDLFIKKIPDLKLVLIPSSYEKFKIMDKNIELRYNGEANRYYWNGWFQNKRLWRY